jgi:hypothetical protein
VGGGGGGLAPKRNVFLGKNFADPTIKKSKHILVIDLHIVLTYEY